jgi:hypothetical protein
MYDEDSETSVDRTIGLELSVELARLGHGDSEDFENWLRDSADQLDELDGHAERVEQ